MAQRDNAADLFSLQAEQAVLSILMQHDDGPLVARENGLAANDFYKSLHVSVFASVQAVAEKCGKADVITVSEHMAASADDDQLGFLTDLATQGVGSLAGLPEYCKIVLEYSRRRRWLVGLQAATSVIYSGKDYLTGELCEDVFGEAARHLSSLDDEETGAGFSVLKDELQLFVADLEARFKGELPPGLITGYSAVDFRLGGAQGLWIVAGRPGMGKTAYMLNIMRQTAFEQMRLDEGERGSVLSFNLEMSNLELARRLVSQQAPVAQGLLKSGKVLSDKDHSDQQARLFPALAKLISLPVYLCDRASVNVLQIVAMCEGFARRQKISLITIDYLQLIENVSSAHSRADQVGDITRRLKILSKSLNCPVMLLSQLNRDVEKRPNKIPKISDLRDSGSIEQDADIIQFPYRDEYYNEESASKGQVMIRTAKLRDGEPGDDFLDFNASTGRMDSRMDRDVLGGSGYDFEG